MDIADEVWKWIMKLFFLHNPFNNPILFYGKRISDWSQTDGGNVKNKYEFYI